MNCEPPAHCVTTREGLRKHPRIPTITPEQASKAGFVAITTDVHMVRERSIYDSIEDTLTGCRAVWITTGKGTVQAARLRSELLTIQNHE